MKYIVMLGDGMADTPVPQLGGKTPLEAAHKPTIDALAAQSELGLVKTVPEGFAPGSDVANLSVMGYDPAVCYTGRSPLEAVSIGIQMQDGDLALRCNFVTLSDERDYHQKTMLDYSAGEISTAEADALVQALNEAFATDSCRFYTGTSYRHCLILQGQGAGLSLTPPHDISDRCVGQYLPQNEFLLGLMQKSYALLQSHPVNRARVQKGLAPANSIWLWGEGTRPKIANFAQTYGAKAAVISAVDLIKGIGICAGMQVIAVPGATGNIDTNFKGKADAALQALLGGSDLVYLHIEAPDECGHRGEVANKVKAIEQIDKQVVAPLLAGLAAAGKAYSILVLPDHPTPLAIKTHTSEPVPYLLYRSNAPQQSGVACYTEKTAAATGNYQPAGHAMMRKLLG